MSKPDKIPIETKKCTCYYGIAASSKVRVGSYGAKKICCWLGRQIKIEKVKTEKAKKTEKADKDREDKDREGRQRQRRQKNKLVYSKIFVSYNCRWAVTVQRTSWKYGRSALWIVRYLSVFSLVEMASLFNGTNSLSESYLFSES